jgi:hypothetical protein
VILAGGSCAAGIHLCSARLYFAHDLRTGWRQGRRRRLGERETEARPNEGEQQRGARRFGFRRFVRPLPRARLVAACPAL